MPFDISILAIVLTAMGSSSILGVLCGLAFSKIPHRLNDIVLGFAAGIMLAASVLGLMAPAFAESSNFITPLLGAFTGAFIISLLDKIIPHLHRIAGIDSSSSADDKSKILLFSAAIALHKIPEGLATGVSFSSGNTGSILTIASALSLQNIPESIVITAPLIMAGVSTKRTIIISFAIAAISIASTLAGVGLSAIFAECAPFLLASAGGAILYVISHEMIPETHSHGYEKPATFALITGLLLVIIMQKLLAGFSF